MKLKGRKEERGGRMKRGSEERDAKSEWQWEEEEEKERVKKITKCQ